MKIGTMSQQKRPDKMKRPRFLSCEEVPRQIVSSAMAQVSSDRRRSTRADGVAAFSVPKGHWKLARRGGFFLNIESEPQPGRRKSRDTIPSPLRGSAHLVFVTGG